MVQTDPIDRLMRAALTSDEEFVLTLDDLLRRDLRISIRELSEASGIAQSSLYKILHGKRSPNLSTLRAIIRAMRKFYRSGEGEFIGLIVARPVLETIEERTAEVDSRRVKCGIPGPHHGRRHCCRSAGRAGRGGRHCLRSHRVECHRAARPYPGGNHHPPRIGPAGDRACRPQGVALISI